MGDMTISDALSIGNNKLEKITDNYINETFWILSKSLKKSKSELILNTHNVINVKEFNHFINLIHRRQTNEPLQLILKSVPFYQYEFSTYKDVFIIRPETEICIDILKKYNQKFASTLEVGCGLGCISITLSLQNLSSNILALDINPKAIKASKLNAKKLKCNNVKFINDDIFNIKHTKKYDLIISNPPYIPLADIKNLDLNVILYDPLEALTDFNDGLNFYKYFANFGSKLLTKNGMMLFEFGGEKQKKILKNIFNFKNYKLSFFNDLNNIPRFLVVQLCN